MARCQEDGCGAAVAPSSPQRAFCALHDSGDPTEIVCCLEDGSDQWCDPDTGEIGCWTCGEILIEGR